MKMRLLKHKTYLTAREVTAQGEMSAGLVPSEAAAKLS
jgi:hypothetical protein